MGDHVKAVEFIRMVLVMGENPELLEAHNALRDEEGFATIIVEHRLRQVQPYVDRVLVMREGRIVDDTADTERMLDAGWLAGYFLNGNGNHAPSSTT